MSTECMPKSQPDDLDPPPDFDLDTPLAVPNMAKYINFLNGNGRWLTLRNFWEELSSDLRGKFSFEAFAKRVGQEGIDSIALRGSPEESFALASLQKVFKTMEADRVTPMKDLFGLALKGALAARIKRIPRAGPLVSNGCCLSGDGRIFVTPEEFIKRHGGGGLSPSVLLHLVDMEIGADPKNVIEGRNKFGRMAVVFDEILALQALVKKFGEKAA